MYDSHPIWMNNRPKRKPFKNVLGSNEKLAAMRRTSRFVNVNKVFKEFADGTSMHGVPHIINARSFRARIFWTLICLGAFIMFFTQCRSLLERYYSYPKKVNVEILQQPVPFPAVSVCNVGHMDFDIADRLSEFLKTYYAQPEVTEYDMSLDDMEMADVDYSYDQAGANGDASDFIDSYDEFLGKANLLIQMYATIYKREGNMELITEALSRLGLPANLGLNITTENGVRLKDFVINCRFMDDVCNITESFRRIFDPHYFNCYTFNPKRSMRLRGVGYGLSLLLFTGSAGQVSKYDILGSTPDQPDVPFIPGTEESDSALASGRGARVVVHSPDTRPIPTAVGYDIPPGFSVTISVKARQNHRIAGNYGNCTKNVTDSFMGMEYAYTLMTCQNNCIQRKIMKDCECVDSQLSFPTEMENLPFCFQLPDKLLTQCDSFPNISKKCKQVISEWSEKIECRNEVYDEMTIHEPDSMETCKCYPPCDDIVYDTSYSLSTLPDNPKEQTTFIMKINRYLYDLEESRRTVLSEKLGSQSLEDGIMGQLSRLNVHVADNNIMRTTESPDYEPTRLVSDIGGQLGLWIGISVITLFEVLQLVADMFRYLTGSRRHVGDEQARVLAATRDTKKPNGNAKRFPPREPGTECPSEIEKLTVV